MLACLQTDPPVLMASFSGAQAASLYDLTVTVASNATRLELAPLSIAVVADSYTCSA